MTFHDVNKYHAVALLAILMTFHDVNKYRVVALLASSTDVFVTDLLISCPFYTPLQRQLFSKSVPDEIRREYPYMSRCSRVAKIVSVCSGGSIGGAMGAIAPPYGLKKYFFSIFLLFIIEKYSIFCFYNTIGWWSISFFGYMHCQLEEEQ